MNVSGLASSTGVGAEPLGHERLGHLRRRRRPRQPMPPRHLVDHHEPDVVAGVAVVATGIAEPDDQLHARTARTYFLSFLSFSSSLSVLPFLATSGSAPAAAPSAGRRGRLPRPSAARCGRASSRRRSRPSTSGRAAGRGRESTGAASSSVTSMSMCSGMSVGRHSHLDLAGHEVEQAALELHALRLALEETGTVTDDGLVHRQLVEVGVQQRAA